MVVTGGDLGREHLQLVRGEIGQGAAVVLQQRVIERIDEALLLIGVAVRQYGRGPAALRIRIEVRQQYLSTSVEILLASLW